MASARAKTVPERINAGASSGVVTTHDLPDASDGQ
jgi:hypothetical protein